jgi:AhpD family alkylhydroperoxidase
MPSPYRYTRPVPKNAATGQVAAVYVQVAEEFILADGLLMSLSPAPDLLAATWALLREAQLAGRAPRVNKEAVGVAVSAINDCRFCVDAHSALVHATGDHQLAEALWRGETPADPEQASLVAWARATGKADEASLAAAPFPPDLAAEYVGTALVTHFINRMVSSLLNEDLLPGRLRESHLVRRLIGRALGRTVHLQPRPGESLPLLADMATGTPPVWAGDSAIGAAYAALQATARSGGALLSEPARDLVQASVAAWDGTQPQRTAVWPEELLTSLAASDQPGARLALLAALAPHGIGDADVAAWRVIHPGDTALIRLVAYGAMTAVERLAAWTAAGYPTAPLAAARR